MRERTSLFLSLKRPTGRTNEPDGRRTDAMVAGDGFKSPRLRCAGSSSSSRPGTSAYTVLGCMSRSSYIFFLHLHFSRPPLDWGRGEGRPPIYRRVGADVKSGPKNSTAVRKFHPFT